MILTQGEKKVWAVTFAMKYADGPAINPLSSEAQKRRCQARFLAMAAVHAMRAALNDAEDGASGPGVGVTSADEVAMLRAMLGDEG